MVDCPICGKQVKEADINAHIDSDCTTHLEDTSPPSTSQHNTGGNSESQDGGKQRASNFFCQIVAPPRTPGALKDEETRNNGNGGDGSNGSISADGNESFNPSGDVSSAAEKSDSGVRSTPISQSALKRSFDSATEAAVSESPVKKHKTSAVENAAPLAERMRPRILDEVCGQEALLGPNGILRTLIETNRVPSMILWGPPGTGKTTIARLIAKTAGTRFVEINSTTTGVGDVKKLFDAARSELALTGRKTIIFCDEIHRFSKSQQDVFLAPVESGAVTLVSATTENPSFKVISALLSRCRVFSLNPLTPDHITTILTRALTTIYPDASTMPSLLSTDLLTYLSNFSSGDARTALNLLSLAASLASTSPTQTLTSLKSSLTQTLVYDRAGDQHYTTISALHKSIRGSNPDAALYYLARMLASGEDPLYIARRLIVIASEDVGLADNSLLSLATSTYTACEKIGLPEARINLAHCAVALALAPKSTRAYRGMCLAEEACREPGVAGLTVPVHLRNAVGRMAVQLEEQGGWGKGYKYNPDYRRGRVKQEYLPVEIRGRKFWGDLDLGTLVDEDLNGEDEDEEEDGEEDDGDREGEDVVLEGESLDEAGVGVDEVEFEIGGE